MHARCMHVHACSHSLTCILSCTRSKRLRVHMHTHTHSLPPTYTHAHTHTRTHTHTHTQSHLIECHDNQNLCGLVFRQPASQNYRLQLLKCVSGTHDIMRWCGQNNGTNCHLVDNYSFEQWYAKQRGCESKTHIYSNAHTHYVHVHHTHTHTGTQLHTYTHVYCITWTCSEKNTTILICVKHLFWSC